LEFHFELRPLEVALGWRGDRPSWFTLSDGWFWITLGEQEVFRVDYQVDRFWGEVCERAPSVLRPVLPDLVPFVESRPEDWPEDWGEDDSEATWSAHLWHLGHRMFSEQAPVPWTLRAWLAGSELIISWIRDGSESRTTVSGERFLATVRDFDARYQAAMHARVAELERDYPETAAANAWVLAKDAEQHATRLEHEFARPPLEEIADLDLVRAGAAELIGG
jgi:hypothetical protein